MLLDAKPGTATFQDAPLGAGETFDGGPVKIKTLSAGGGAATVSVQLDEEPPSKPEELQATVGAGGVQLSWVGADNVRVARYFVFRDGSRWATSRPRASLTSALLPEITSTRSSPKTNLTTGASHPTR